MQANRKQSPAVRRASCALFLASAGAGLYPAVAHGTTYSWIGNGSAAGSWSVASNWINSGGANAVPPLVAPTGDTTDLVFTGNFNTGTTSAQNIGEIHINSLTFGSFSTSNGTFAISASSSGNQYIYLGAGGLVANGSGTIAMVNGANRKIILEADQTWSNSNTAAIFSQRRTIEGAFKITKAGAGTIELQGDGSNFTGGIQLDEGVIRMATLGNVVGTGPITVNTSNNVGFAASGSTQVDQTIAGPVTFGGTGSFFFGGSWNFNLTNTVNMLNNKTISVTNNATFGGAMSGTGVLTKTGSGTLFLGSANTHGGFNVLSGRLSVASDAQLGAAGAPLGIGSLLNAAVGGNVYATGDLNSAGRAINLDATGGALNLGAFNATFGAVSGGGTLTKSGTGTLTIASIHAGGLNVASGAVKVAPNGSNTSVLANLVLPAGTSLNLSDNDLVVDYTGASQYSAVVGLITSGQLASSSSVPGTMLGSADNATFGATNFSGETVDSSSVLVKFTYGGDANLDGKVDVTDLGALATNWQQTGVWTGGDFNYDGTVNVTDLGILATNWQAGASSPLGPSFAEAVAAVGLGGVSVPEPAAIACLGLTGLLATRRRR